MTLDLPFDQNWVFYPLLPGKRYSFKYFVNKKMDSIKIRKYKQEDHKDVSRIFGAGMSDMQTIKNGIALGRKSPYVIGYLTIIFMMGSFYSLFYGFIALTIGLSFQAFMVYFVFNFYTWYVSFISS